MSATGCSPAQIAEKRRIALEKLNAKKAQQKENQQKQQQEGPTAINPTPNAPKQEKPQTLTGASAFINSMKQSSAFYSRQTARAAAHPYKKPPTSGMQNSSYTKDRPNPYSPLLPSPEKKQLATVLGKYITCKVYVISAQRFAVAPSGFHSQMVDVFKSVPSKIYESATRIWNFAISDYSLLQQRMEGLKPDVSIGVIPKSVFKLCSTPAKESNYSVLASIEPELANKLLPFQKEGVCYGISQQGRLMICDEMGLGKTYQALAIADFYKENWPLLICTNASTRESWAKHVHNLLPSVPLSCTLVLTSNQQYFGDSKILITSYNMMERHMSKLLERKFGVLIFDESHNLKNNKAKCTAVADRLAVQAKHVILLSGTPALSRPLELFTQIQMIDRRFMTFKEFTSRYCDGKQTHFGWDATGQSNLEELNVVMKLRFMLRRTKADVLPDLAEKSRETVVLDPALIWMNNNVKENLNTYAKNWTASKGREREEILLRFYAETATVKTRAVCSYLKTLVKEKIKFIVFGHHRVMLDAISECLEKLNVTFMRIDGSTRNEQRAEYIDTFQNDEKCRVAVLSLKACNSGITLTAAEMIIFAELDWNPSTLAQAESRAHRIGQEKSVICRYLMASKTADDIIWSMLNNKQTVLNQAGLFCENLQEAVHTAAPTSFRKISSYFSPDTSRSSLNCSSDDNSFTETVPATTSVDKLPKSAANEPAAAKEPTSLANKGGVAQELKDIEAFFADDDDDTFSNFNV